jgi:hypothetical protein
VNNQGMYLTFEALLSFFLFISLLVLAVPVHQESLSELIVMQKVHDVFKVWNLQNGSEQDLIDLMELTFPTNDFEIEVNGLPIKTFGQKTSNHYAFTGNIYNQLAFKEVKITVYF